MNKKRLVRRIAALVLAAAVALAACATVRAAGEEDQEYTDTLQKNCVLAVRADVFPGFTGEVEATIKDGQGREENCLLTGENRYAVNMKVAEGCYVAQHAVARMGEERYEVRKLSSRLQAAEGEVAVCRLIVIEYRIVEGEAESAPGKEGTEAMETGRKITQEAAAETKPGKGGIPGGRFTLVLWLSALGCAAVYWYIRYGRRKYSGR